MLQRVMVAVAVSLLSSTTMITICTAKMQIQERCCEWSRRYHWKKKVPQANSAYENENSDSTVEQKIFSGKYVYVTDSIYQTPLHSIVSMEHNPPQQQRLSG